MAAPHIYCIFIAAWELLVARYELLVHMYWSAQLWPTLCNPTDRSLPGSSVHGIFQARILEWVAISFSKLWHGGSNSLTRDRTQAPCLGSWRQPPDPQGNPSVLSLSLFFFLYHIEECLLLHSRLWLENVLLPRWFISEFQDNDNL